MLYSFATAQSDSEVGMVCPDLYGPQNPSKKDPNGWWITEPSMCESIGGKLYADDVIVSLPHRVFLCSIEQIRYQYVMD